MEILNLPKFIYNLNCWDSNFNEFVTLVMIQTLASQMLWNSVSFQLLSIFGILVLGQPLDLRLLTIITTLLVFVGTGLVFALIHIIFAIILHKGVHENRVAYLIVWLMYMTISWCGMILDFLSIRPSWEIAVVAAFMSLFFLLFPCYLLYSIRKRSRRNFTLNSDEILAMHGDLVDGLTHLEAMTMFKKVKRGPLVITKNRRGKKRDRSIKSQSCDNLIDA